LQNWCNIAYMDEFGALIHSLGEYTVTYIGEQNLARLDIFGDDVAGTAYIEIALADNTWPSQSAAVDKMIEIREMYFDELAIDYRFISEDSETRQSSAARQPAFCMA